jgi:hypothetical protein
MSEVTQIVTSSSDKFRRIGQRVMLGLSREEPVPLDDARQLSFGYDKGITPVTLGTGFAKTRVW